MNMKGEARIPTSESKNTQLLKQLPEVWALLRPRRGLLAVGLLLMAINRVSGLALPASAKFLIDDVIGKRQTKLLLPLVATVLCGHLDPGRDVIRANSIAFEGRPAADCRAPPQGAGTRWTPAGRLL